MELAADREGVSILLVDDHAVLAEPVRLALRAHGYARVAAADVEDLSAEGIVRRAREVGATVVLLDLHLGPQVSIPFIAPLRETGAKVVLFTASQDPRLLAAALRAGVEAVIDKGMSFARLVAVVGEVAAGCELMPPEEREALIEALGERHQEEDERLAPFEALTEREAHVLRGLIDGDSPKQIARREEISVSTVRGHLERIFAKLGVQGQREALSLARTAGWPAAADRIRY